MSSGAPARGNGPASGAARRAPLISVVLPFFQVGDFLAEAIDSVLAQSFADWELILVDDGSTDAGSRIARDYADRHPGRITLLEHPGRANRGSSASRNLGAAHARGAWIATIDGDDAWLPGTLADRALIIGAHPGIGLVMGASLYWHSWAGEGAPPDTLVPVGAPPDRVYDPPLLHDLLYPLARGAAPGPNTVLVRVDVLRRVGGWEDEFPTAYDDQALLSKLYLATPAYVSGACWDRYRQRPGSISDLELRGRAYHAHRRRFLEWFDGYLDDQGGPDRIRRRVGTALWPYRHPVLNRILSATRRCRRFIGGRK